MSKVVFKADIAGIRQALSAPAVHDAVMGKAEAIAAAANASAAAHRYHPGYKFEAGEPPYAAHMGEHSHVAIANVSTNTFIGRLDNSRNNTLQKEGGIQ